MPSDPKAAPGHGRPKDRFGRTMTRLCGGALALNLLLVLGLLLVLAWQGLPGFWPRPLERFVLDDGTRLLGEVVASEEIPASAPAHAGRERFKVRTGNRDVEAGSAAPSDFVWIEEPRIAERSRPEDAVAIERLADGMLYGTLAALERNGEVLARGPEATARALEALMPRKEDERERVRDLEKGRIGDVNYELRAAHRELRRLERSGRPEAEKETERAALLARVEELKGRFTELDGEFQSVRAALKAEVLVVETAAGQEARVPAGDVVRVVFPNAIGFFGRLGVYGGRLWEFLSAEPREANTEGGIFPAIFGTVLMVFIMSIFAVPLGVLAAVYLREYAKQGLVTRIVRIAVNNLAGTPSIVFGVFGLGFFVYFVGGAIDRTFYAEDLPTPNFGTGGILWASLTLSLLTLPVVIVATEEGLAAVPRAVREASLAMGATRWETIRRVVLPASGPAILTGMILSIARAAGEVAPLMIVGVVKAVPELPLDHHLPFLHLDRKFMHLAFHIFDLGFQSPNVEATRPLVFMTALFLIVVVTVLNLVAIVIRNRLRTRYAGSAV